MRSLVASTPATWVLLPHNFSTRNPDAHVRLYLSSRRRRCWCRSRKRKNNLMSTLPTQVRTSKIHFPSFSPASLAVVVIVTREQSLLGDGNRELVSPQQSKPSPSHHNSSDEDISGGAVLPPLWQETERYSHCDVISSDDRIIRRTRAELDISLLSHTSCLTSEESLATGRRA